MSISTPTNDENQPLLNHRSSSPPHSQPSTSSSSTAWRLQHAPSIIKLALPILATDLVQIFPIVINLQAAGSLGTLELGVLTLSSTLFMSLVLPLTQGLLMGLETMGAQLYATHPEALGNLGRTTYLLLLMISMPLLLLFNQFTHPLLTIIGPTNNPQLIELASLYFARQLYIVPFLMLQEVVKKLLLVQGKTRPGLIIGLLMAPIQLVLVRLTLPGSGILGLPYATLAAHGVILLILFAMLGRDNPLLLPSPEHVHSYRRTITDLIKLAIPSTVMVAAMVLPLEGISVAAGKFGGPTAIASQSITNLWLQITVIVDASLATATALQVGKKLNNPIQARSATITSLVLALVLGPLMSLTLSHLGVNLVKLMTKDPMTLELTYQLLQLLIVLQPVLCLKLVGGGVLRGQGKQRQSAVIKLITTYCVALPLAIHWVRDWGLIGCWLGLGSSWLLNTILEWYIILEKSNWSQLANDCQNLLAMPSSSA